jgi:PAS domain S-box-containing protein
MLQALYPVPDSLDGLAGSVQASVGKYRQLTYLREPLKTSYILTLTLALGLSVLTAIWAAFFSARRLMLPIHNLAEGTRAVAEGNYATRLPPSGRDELGFLVQSFNEMTRRLSHARDQARTSRLQVESQRAYLEAVLERISTGVLTLDASGTLHTANEAAARILGVALSPRTGRKLDDFAGDHAALGQFLSVVMPHVEHGSGEWHEEFELPGRQGRKIIVCRGTRLPDRHDLAGGWVVVFDDITALVQAQREAAWSEVARRLAHEIKNPLTPIQLSAERLRHRFLDRLSPEEAEVLDRSTWTIVQQVESLKSMVRAFADYASTPAADFTRIDLNDLAREVVDLYGPADHRGTVTLDLADHLPPVEADRSRLRQVLHNLIKNALEAHNEGGGPARVSVATRAVEVDGESDAAVELSVRDAGPGIRADMVDRLFEPYMTGKPRGSGLGLAIVRKIVEEHGGQVAAENAEGGGAIIRVRLPRSSTPVERGSAA